MILGLGVSFASIQSLFSPTDKSSTVGREKKNIHLNQSKGTIQQKKKVKPYKSVNSQLWHGVTDYKPTMLCSKYNIVSVTVLQLLLLLSSLKTKITFNKIVPFHQQKLLTLTFMNGYVFEKIMKKKQKLFKPHQWHCCCVHKHTLQLHWFSQNVYNNNSVSSLWSPNVAHSHL